MPRAATSSRIAAVSDEALRRLLGIRAVLLAASALALGMAANRLGAVLPLAPILGVLGLYAGLLAFTAWQRQRHAVVHPGEVFLQLTGDAAALAALVYFSGGYANPFISLLLLPLILCAVTLHAVHVWAMTAWVAILYSLLAHYYLPLRLDLTGQEAIDLHLIGMWLNFLLTAGIVAAFVAGLAKALREREAELTRLREQALRDEHLFSLGMQAAAAAHDLATPLNTLMLSLRELQRDYAGDDELGPSLELMTRQGERMDVVLGRLAAAAGAARAADSTTQPLADWLAETFAHWQLMRPSAHAGLDLRGSQPGPTVRVEPILISLLATLLNNAADASPDGIELIADWGDDSLRIEVLDRGPGLGGTRRASGGWGVGLTLAEAALERFDGRLGMVEREGGGMAVRVELALARLLPQA